jgi:hypothetical protein
MTRPQSRAEVTPDEHEILRGGAKILEEFASGTRFVEECKPQEGFVPSAEAFRVLGKAHKALSGLKNAKRHSAFAELMGTLALDMSELVANGKLAPAKLSNLSVFFGALADLFLYDLETQYESDLPEIYKPEEISALL